MNCLRPVHISEADWDRMSWYSKMRLAKAAKPRAVDLPADVQGITVKHIPGDRWRVSNGTCVAYTTDEEAAWFLVRLVVAAA